MHIEFDEVLVTDISDDALERLASDAHAQGVNFSYTDISLGCQV
ncbi:MAG: hypothetical protein NWS01_05030 [Burkholderiales bacterium]|jgi:hypothetical protein|nr:hypothetical protein [Burkholderiales bacterium]